MALLYTEPMGAEKNNTWIRQRCRDFGDAVRFGPFGSINGNETEIDERGRHRSSEGVIPALDATRGQREAEAIWRAVPFA